MRTLEGEQVLMRIFIGESEQWEHRPLYVGLVELFRRSGLAGATVLKGVAGFGAGSVVHTASILRLSADLPLVISSVSKHGGYAFARGQGPDGRPWHRAARNR